MSAGRTGLVSLGLALTALLVVFSLENGEVMHEDEDFVLHLSQIQGGDLQVGEGWCLQAAHATGAQVNVASCEHTQSTQQKWSYDESTGLVQLHSGKEALCAHADYISEAEGSLLSMQPCKKGGSERQMFDLDSATHTLHMRHTPELCLHSVNTKLKSGRPVLLLQCHTAQKTQGTHKAVVHDAKAFVGHSLTPADKSYEAGVVHEIMAETAHQDESAHQDETAHQDESEQPQESPEEEEEEEEQAAPQEEEEQDDQQDDQVATFPSDDQQDLDSPSVGYDDQQDLDSPSVGYDEDQITSIIDSANRKSAALKKKMHLAESSLSGTSDSQVLRQAQAAKQHGAEALARVADHEKTQLQGVIKGMRDSYHAASDQATTKLKAVKATAHALSVKLQRRAQDKTAAVIEKARKSLQAKLNTLSTTLTDSVDQRQRARAKLVALRSKHADEVQLAQAALDLAKVNEATHLANTQAREAAKRSHTRAARAIGFAKTILGSRLKAVRTTERLSVDKAELKSHAIMTEAEEALSHTTQSVLMALDDADASVSLEDIVGKDAVDTSVGAASSEVSADAPSAESEFDMEVEPADVSKLNDEELIGSHAAMLSHASVDTMYTAQMHKCSFPFVYNGEKYYHCKSSLNGHWCATDVDEKNGVKKWDYCVQNQRAVFLAKQAAMEAAKLEIKRVLAATGAQITPEALRESLQAAAAAQAAPEPVQKEGKPDDEDLKSRNPVMGRVQAESAVDELINRNAAQH